MRSCNDTKLRSSVITGGNVVIFLVTIGYLSQRKHWCYVDSRQNYMCTSWSMIHIINTPENKNRQTLTCRAFITSKNIAIKYFLIKSIRNLVPTELRPNEIVRTVIISFNKKIKKTMFYEQSKKIKIKTYILADHIVSMKGG
jgi:hypothetical protein